MKRADVARKLAAMWPDLALRERARIELDRYGSEAHESEVDRVRLAILKLSDGELQRLAELVTAAKNDYRDLLISAEYPAEGQALWALRPTLTTAERQRLEQLRVQDRRQYLDWLEQ
jgi:hypothetical protein